jgi:hypothetical protein
MNFNRTEFSAIHNSDFFYTKAAAIKKIDALLADVRDEIKSVIEKEKLVFPKEADARTGKIFRGENYLGLPYLVLDYPKYFSSDSVLAFRTLFWWGNFFSHTMHLEGKELDKKRNLLIQNWKSFRKKNIYLCVNDTPWQYYYKKDNYIAIERFSETELKKFFIEKNFIKLSRKTPLKEYKKLKKFSKDSFTMFSSSLFSQ